MILTASVIGGWHKLELWGHTHAALFGLLFMVCALEIVLWKMTTSLFDNSPDMDYETDYEGADEYEEDIYYEDLHSNLDQIVRRHMRYRRRQQQQQEQQMTELIDSIEMSPSTAIYNGHVSSAGVIRYFH